MTASSRRLLVLLGIQGVFWAMALVFGWGVLHWPRFVDSTQAVVLLQSRDGGYENGSGPGCRFTDLRFDGRPAIIRRDPETGDRVVNVPVRNRLKVTARLNDELWTKTSSTLKGVSAVTVTCDRVKWDRVALLPATP